MRTLLQAITLTTLMLLATAAFGQDTGGLRANDQPVEADAHMTNIAPTPVVLVDGQNDGANIAGNKFMQWSDAVALGKVQYRALVAPPSLGEIARQYRLAKTADGFPATWDGKRWNCPSGLFSVWADEHEARAGKENFAHCVAQ